MKKEEPTTTTEAKPDQMRLLPEKPLRIANVMLELASLPKTLHGPEPRPSLCASVRDAGVLEPIVVTDLGEGRYRVEDGRRRVKAAREAGHDRIPARVLSKDQIANGVLTIILNQQRDKNDVAEAEAIRELLSSGASEGDIQRETGMPVGRIRARLRLVMSLNKELYREFRTGKLRPALADKISRLPAKTQEQLRARYESQGDKLSSDDVSDARRVAVDRATGKLPSSLWGGGDSAWCASAVVQLGALLGSAPTSLRPQARKIFDEQISGAINLLKQETGRASA